MPTPTDDIGPDFLLEACRDHQEWIRQLGRQLDQARLRQQKLARRALNLGMAEQVAAVFRVDVPRLGQLADLADLADQTGIHGPRRAGPVIVSPTTRDGFA